MKTKLLYILFFFTAIAFSQNVNIPDANFKNALLVNSSINTNNDAEIQLSEAAAYRGSINVNNKNIDDLTGIEAFTSITKLYCTSNYLSKIDISANTILRTLHCGNNNLSEIDVSINTNLTELYCYGNNLSNLDISNNTNLTSLLCNNNNLAFLDVTANTTLTELNCSFNNLVNLNVSNNTALNYLKCSSNNLTGLDVSSNVLLERFYGDNNGLTSLNLANGNNALISRMNAQNNVNLSCIQIDSGFRPSYYYWQKDREASYSKNCSIINKSSVNSKTFNNAVNSEFSYSISIYPNPVADMLYISTNNILVKEIEVYNTIGKKVIATKSNILNVSNLTNGIYFLQMKSTDGLIATKKFVKK